MNLTRIMSALLGFPLVLAILVFGNTYFVDVAFAAIAAVSIHEYFNCLKSKCRPVIWVGYLASALIAFIHVIPQEQILNIIIAIIPIGIVLLFLNVIISNMKINVNDIAITFFGICYIGLFLMFIPLLHGMENGKILIWYLLFSAWGTDIFAYVAGKTIGRHKFSKISPNKTIEGCIGGIIGAVVMCLIYTYVCNSNFGLNISYVYILVVSIILSIIGQIGDFAASSIKRYAGIKDFSNLIPGHGGMLDRIDSVIFIAPFAYILLRMLG